MKNVFTMAGNFASHAIWSISTSGDILVPIVGYLKSDEKFLMKRLAMSSVEAAVSGEQKITNISDKYIGATFIRDSFITLETGKIDALLIDIRFRDDDARKMQYAIPYRNANHEKGFAVHRLKLIDTEGFSAEERPELTDAFFDGLEFHKEGGKIWKDCYEDEISINANDSAQGKGDFSAEEFEKLKRAPFLIFLLVAGIDGTIDKKELIAFTKGLTSPEFLQNSTLNRIVTNIVNDLPSMMREIAAEEVDIVKELGSIASLVDDKLDEESANDFKISLFNLSKEVAQASGGILGFGNKISKQEKAALALITLCLGLIGQVPNE